MAKIEEGKYYVDGEGLYFYPHRKEEVKAWCKMSDIEPYKE